MQSYTYALGGLPVSAVTFGQPAALAGLQKGDVITSVNGTIVRTMEYSKAIHVLNAAFSSDGTHVALDIVR
jgi:C-terminal processing protease CtpA/Prc